MRRRSDIPVGPARPWRQVLRRIHLCIGATLCLPLIILGLTGSVLVFEDELRAALEPAPHASALGQAHPLAVIIAAAQGAAPAGYVAAAITPAAGLGDSAEVRFADPRRGPGPGGVMVFVDPVSLAVLGTRDPGAGLVRHIASLHSTLLLRTLGGRSVVGWLGIAMLMLGLTGPVLWWPSRGQWRTAFTVRSGARGYTLLRDLHGMAGIWGVGVLVIVSFSGVYLAFPQAVTAAIATVLPARDLRPNTAVMRVTPLPGTTPLDADGAVALAQAAVPGTEVRQVALPLRRDQPFRAGLVRGGESSAAALVTVYVDPWARRVIEVRDPRLYTSGERLLAWLRPLHEGAALGWPWRILVFLSGFLPPLFAGTGVTMWLLKRNARARLRGGAARRGPIGAAGD